MQAWKRMERRWAIALVQHGDIRIAPLTYYRNLERDSHGIADPMEGRAIGLLQGSFSSAADISRLNRLGSAFRIEGGGSVITFDGSAYFPASRNDLVFCLSGRADAPAFDPAYDTTVACLDLEAVASLLTRKFPDELGNAECGEVIYATRKWDVRTEEPLDSDPFRKEPAEKFIRQEERRIAWPNKRSVMSPVDLNCEELTSYFKIVE